MFIEILGAVRTAQEWSQRAPRYQGEFVFGPESPEKIVFGVFGDSVGCGLGVPSVERTFAGSVARRLAVRRRVVCRISAFSGARGRGLALQPPAGDERFAAISIGTNDIIHGESLSGLENAVLRFPHARHFGPNDLKIPFAPSHYALDGFHPNESAHAMIADAALDRLIA